MMIKKVLRYWARCFKIYSKTPVLSKYLANGVYCYKDGKIRKGLSVFPIIICSGNKKKIEKQSCVDVFFGGWSKKTVIVTEKYVISFYKGEQSFKWFDNMQNYLSECTYPKCEYVCFNKKKLYNVCTKKYYDYVYDVELFEKFSRYGIKNVISYVQHGDCAGSNILANGKEFKIIDFDTIDIKHCFYDIIRYLLDLKDGIKKFCDGYFDKDLSQVLTDEGIPLTVEEKDKYLAIFWLKNNKHIWKEREDLSDIPDEYVITKKVLSDLSEQYLSTIVK